METIKKLILFLFISAVIIGGACYYFSTTPYFSITASLHDIRNNQNPRLLEVKKFSNSVSQEVWALLQRDSKLLQKSDFLDDKFKNYINLMVSSYINKFIQNKSKIIRVSDLGFFEYAALHARLFYFYFSNPLIPKGEDYKATKISGLKILNYTISFDLLFKYENQNWIIYAIENLNTI